MILVSLFFLFFKLLCLFVISNFLESEEIFTRFFVKFTVDKVNDILNLWDLNELQSIDSSVSDFKCDIKSNELGLERCDSDQHLQEPDESFTSTIDCLTTTGKTEQSRALFLFVLTSKGENR